MSVQVQKFRAGNVPTCLRTGVLTTRQSWECHQAEGECHQCLKLMYASRAGIVCLWNFLGVPIWKYNRKQLLDYLIQQQSKQNSNTWTKILSSTTWTPLYTFHPPRDLQYGLGSGDFELEKFTHLQSTHVLQIFNKSISLLCVDWCSSMVKRS